MQPITIAEKLWLEPTVLGATLNYVGPEGCHYRVGMGFRSLGDCDKALQDPGSLWVIGDKSLMIQGTKALTLTFCPGTALEKQFTLEGEELEIFRQAIRFLSLASQPQNN